MKIAIYGDSFGSEDPIFLRYHKNYAEIKPSWVTLLRKHYDIDNYCAAGSDLYFSYSNFIKNYQDYDVNIFIYTCPHRLSTKYNNFYIHNHNVDSASWKLETETNIEKINICKASIQYFLYLQNDQKNVEIANLFREKIYTLDSKCIELDSFGSEGLYNITAMENKCWNYVPNYTKYSKISDLRFCHMTKNNNIVLYEQIKNCIEHQKKFCLNIDSYIKPNLNEKNTYIVRNQYVDD